MPFTKSPKSKPRNKVQQSWNGGERSLELGILPCSWNDLHFVQPTQPGLISSPQSWRNDAMTTGIIWYPSFSSWPFPSLFLEPWATNDWKGEICLPIVKNSCRECHLITNCQRTRLVIGMLLMDDDAGYCIGKWGLHGPTYLNMTRDLRMLFC